MMLSATSGTTSSDCFGRTGSIRGRDGKKSNSKPVDNKQTQAAQCVGLKVQNISDFLRSKAFKSLASKGYTPQISEIVPDENQQRGQTRINALPLEVVRKYWLWQAHRGNKQALALVDALMAETLERRFDEAFGVERTEPERNDRLSKRIQQLEGDLSRLGEEFALDDVVRDERDYFERLLRENGIDPWERREEEQ